MIRVHDMPPIAEVSALASMVKLACIPLLSRRAVSVFLNTDARSSLHYMPPLVMRLMSQCLEGYMHHLGGDVVYVTDFLDDHGGKEDTPTCRAVTTESKSYQILECGYAFLRLPDRRLVVKLMYRNFGNGETISVVDVYSHEDSSDFVEGWEQYTRRHHYLLGRTAFADGEPIIQTRRYSWDDIVISNEARSMLHLHVETFLASTSRLRAAGVSAKRGLILAGPPGTGKTLLGKVLANTLGVTFLWVLPRHIKSPDCIVKLMETARFVTPAVVFFEDLDLFGEDRETSQSAVLGELMNQLDGVSTNDHIIAIATTNRLDVIERALRNRPGRFDRVVEIGLPDQPLRRKMLGKFLATADISETDLVELARRTTGYSGAQLAELVTTLHLLAGERAGHRLAIDKSLIDAAIADMQVEERKPIGFGE